MKFKNAIQQAGMTLTEVIVVSTLYTILMLVISLSITNLYKTNSFAFAQASEVENARRGMTQWNRDAKEMTTAEDGTFPVAVIDEHHFAYYSDTDQDATVEYVEYILATTTLYKHTYQPSGSPATYNLTTPDKVEILSEYVQNIAQATSTFLYFDNIGTQLSSTSPLLDVRYIRAQFVINVDPIHSPGEFMLRSSIAPRNLKDNL